MDGTTVSALTEVLFDILLGCFSLGLVSWVLVGIQTFINDRRHEKREEDSAKRDAEYHEQRMKELQK